MAVGEKQGDNCFDSGCIRLVVQDIDDDNSKSNFKRIERQTASVITENIA